jgi:hypothetical protein
MTPKSIAELVDIVDAARYTAQRIRENPRQAELEAAPTILTVSLAQMMSEAGGIRGRGRGSERN